MNVTHICPFPSSPQLLKEAVESQRMCELMKQQEVHLKQQVSQQPLLFIFYSSIVIDFIVTVYD